MTDQLELFETEKSKDPFFPAENRKLTEEEIKAIWEDKEKAYVHARSLDNSINFLIAAYHIKKTKAYEWEKKHKEEIILSNISHYTKLLSCDYSLINEEDKKDLEEQIQSIISNNSSRLVYWEKELKKYKSNIQQSQLKKEKKIKDPIIYDKIPNAFEWNTIYNYLGTPEQILQYAERQNKTAHSSKVKVITEESIVKILHKTSSMQYTLNIDTSKISQTTKSFFAFVGKKISSMVIPENPLNEPYVSIPLQDLVDYGFYKNIKSANLHIDENFQSLKSIQLIIKPLNDKGEPIESKKIDTQPFHTMVLDDQQVKFNLPFGLDWFKLTSNTLALLPSSYYVLSPKAQNLLYNICSLLRTNAKKFKDKNSTTLSFRKAQQVLYLPEENHNSSPFDHCVKPILDAAEEINNAISDFNIKPIYDRSLKISALLDHGYLQINVKGEYKDLLSNIATARTTKIENNLQKIEDRKEKAFIEFEKEKLKNNKKE